MVSIVRVSAWSARSLFLIDGSAAGQDKSRKAMAAADPFLGNVTGQRCSLGSPRCVRSGTANLRHAPGGIRFAGIHGQRAYADIKTAVEIRKPASLFTGGFSIQLTDTLRSTIKLLIT